MKTLYSVQEDCYLFVTPLCPSCQSWGSVLQWMQFSKASDPTAQRQKGFAGCRSHSKPCYRCHISIESFLMQLLQPFLNAKLSWLLPLLVQNMPRSRQPEVPEGWKLPSCPREEMIPKSAAFWETITNRHWAHHYLHWWECWYTEIPWWLSNWVTQSGF